LLRPLKGLLLVLLLTRIFMYQLVHSGSRSSRALRSKKISLSDPSIYLNQKVICADLHTNATYPIISG